MLQEVIKITKSMYKMCCIHSHSPRGLWKRLLCIYTHTIYKYTLYIKTSFFFFLLQQTVMQYQLSDDLPSTLPFRLFPTIERDNSGRSDSSRGHYQRTSYRLKQQESSTSMFLDSSVWPALNTVRWLTALFYRGQSLVFFLPCRLLMYLKLRCDLPPKRSVWISHVCPRHMIDDHLLLWCPESDHWSNIDYFECFC